MNDRPNVLLLLTDQERYDLTAPDGLEVNTPNLDRIAEEGVRFTRAYTPISICTSARASMLTGLFPHAHGMLNNSHEADSLQPNLPPDLPTFGEGLAEVGYENTYLGKWHVGRDQVPGEFGFRYLGGSDTHHDDIDRAFRAYRERIGVDREVELIDPITADYEDDPTLIAAETPVPVEATRAYYLAERTIERIEGLAADEGEEPFFHRTDFLGPHHPYVVPEPYASMYDPEGIEPWPTFAETFDGKPQVHENYLHYRGVADFDWETWSRAVARYFGFVTMIDDQVGRILDAVAEHGMEETLVVHTSDHGDFTGSHRQFNKGPLMYEETYHVPLAAMGAGVERGTCEAFVSLVDLMPTFLDLAGAAVPEVHGRSLRPLLDGDVPGDWRESITAQYHGDEFGLYSQRMVRTEGYKFVYNAPDVNEFYDLHEDPHELRNLVSHPEYEKVRREHEQRLLGWMERTDDPIARWTKNVLG